MSYDDWKLATPWDDEVSLTIEFECKDCQLWHEDFEVIVGSDSYGVDVECAECGTENYIELGD